MPASHLDQPEKLIGDIVSVGTVAGTLAGVLPSIAAAFTIIWTGIRIWETETVQRLVNKENTE